ncbi:uncharacterized protein BDZ99DRAFT_457924 [Mytilinidion resinicola]|uniref:Uncharacterized protein n=1 Tax=Mytilinidion resinicola TaxID=574789 RepID=A0A6A6Z6Y5_9PEZI|nr:uncharacterized protein BDZ99DRAFT_457924 [Mytilinidion resinicola]KAF2816005.1 hypothetical protein BDZ99DRAFT_457924 [Mytilinidion resinicola]
MPLLPNIPSDRVHSGWWRNLTAPAYRQYLWSATNVEAVIILGILGILGTIAGDKLWPIMRHYLQPNIQLPDPENLRLKLSRMDAIKAFWAKMKGLSRRHRQALRPVDTTIELRFGLFAILNIVSFLILGIFIPFLLAEGLQGEAIVLARKDLQGSYSNLRNSAAFDKGVRERTSDDFRTCVTDSRNWSQTAYCADLRKTLPSYTTENMDLRDPVFAELPYQFLVEKGDTNYKALRLGRNITFQDAGFNVKPGGKKLLHELTCVPVSLDPFITYVNGSFEENNRVSKRFVNGAFELRVPDLLPSALEQGQGLMFDVVLHDSMLLGTSNDMDSGRETYVYPVKTVINHGDQGATWFQTDVDATLPWIEYKGNPALATHLRDDLAVGMLYGSPTVYTRFRLQNFLLTFKPGRSPVPQITGSPSDDPIYGAHRHGYGAGYVADREVSALGCAEVFKVCSEDECVARPIGHFDGWLDRCYPAIMSVWVSAQNDPIYAWTRNFLVNSPNQSRRWQDDVEERFVRSMLRFRYAATYAAEQDVATKALYPEVRWETYPLLSLYRNPDYTNVNLLGFAATASGYLYIIAARYRLALLSPLTLPLKFSARAARTGLEKLKAFIVFAKFCIFVVAARPNTVPLDTLHSTQDNDEPDNPPRMARNRSNEATV